MRVALIDVSRGKSADPPIDVSKTEELQLSSFLLAVVLVLDVGRFEISNEKKTPPTAINQVG